YVLEEVRKALEPTYGSENLEQGGLTIQTTLDVKLQKIAQAAIEKNCAQYDLKYGSATLVEFNRELKQSTTQQVVLSTVVPHVQAALVALDVHTGAIRAM